MADSPTIGSVALFPDYNLFTAGFSQLGSTALGVHNVPVSEATNSADKGLSAPLAECWVLGYLLAQACTGRLEQPVLNALSNEHFFYPGHQALFRMVSGVVGVTTPLNIAQSATLLAELLSADDPTLEVGALESYMRGLYGLVTVANSGEHADAATAYFMLCCESLETHRSHRAQAEDRFVAPPLVAKPLKTSLRTLVERFDDCFVGQAEFLGLSTGFPLLDTMLLGLRPGDLTVVAAQTGCGRNVFLANVLLHMARTVQLPVVFYSSVMDQFTMTSLLMANVSKVGQRKVETADLDEQDWPAFSAAVGELVSLPVTFYGEPGVRSSVIEFKKSLAQLSTDSGLSAVIVDYDSLTSDGDLLSELRALAIDIQCPIVVSNTVSTAVSTGITPADQNKRPPCIDDLAIPFLEQVATAVLFLYSDEGLDERIKCASSDDGLAVNLRIAKNARGRVGTLSMQFYEDRGIFEEKAMSLSASCSVV